MPWRCRPPRTPPAEPGRPAPRSSRSRPPNAAARDGGPASGGSSSEWPACPAIAEASLEAGEFGKAAALADEMLTRGMGPAAPWDWNAGNLVHHGHVTLGRLALLAGDVAATEEHLRLAGSTHGSPQLNSFGPDFRLMNQLLARGRTEVVLGYLELCRRFWTPGHGALDRWTAELRAGRRPVLHEFGIDPDEE